MGGEQLPEPPPSRVGEELYLLSPLLGLFTGASLYSTHFLLCFLAI